MPEIIIKNPDVKDPNKELEKYGVTQDLPFGGDNTLLKPDVVTRRPQILEKDLRYFKFKTGSEYKYGFVLEGLPIDTKLPGFEWIGGEEYFKSVLGEEEYSRRFNRFRTKKRFEELQRLEAVRGAKAIEDKLKKRN